METDISEQTLTNAERRHPHLDLIGDTPLLTLRTLTDGTAENGVRISAKAEWMNLSGSVKARPALSMILGGETSGALDEEKTIIDASSGNTAVAYATIGAALGYDVTICIPENATKERKAILSGLGAELVFTDPAEEMDGAIRKAREIVNERPEQYYYPDQYGNDLNWQAHYHTTGREVLEQTGGEITHFVAGLGTTGTFVGTARRLKQEKPDVTAVSVQPDAALHGLEGWKHLESAMVPGIYDPDVADRDIRVSTAEAHETMHHLAEREGLFLSPSSGAAARAAQKVAGKLEEGHVVTILPDSGEKYMELWTDGS